MNGMESVRDLLDGGQRAPDHTDITHVLADLPSAARYVPPADHEETSP